MAGRPDSRRSLDQDREQAIARLTGINSSKKTYYPELRQKVDELEATNRLLERVLHSLGSISQALTLTTHGVDAFLGQLTATVGALTGATHTIVVEARHAQRGVPATLERIWPVGSSLRLEEDDALKGVAGRLETHAEPFWLEGEEGYPLARGLKGTRSESPDHGTWLCIPMRRGMVASGALLAALEGRRWIEAGEMEALRMLGSQTAIALENARLYEKGERLRARAEEHYSTAVEQKSELELKHAELQEALARLSSVEHERVLQEERTRIARELHDSVAQVLYSIGLQLDWARSRTEDDDELHRRISSLRELAGSCVKDIRQTIFDLSPARVGDTGLRPALGALAREYSKLCDAHIHVDVARAPSSLPRLVEEGLYRIAQEALFNVYKHAEASEVHLSLGRTASGDMELEIRDDGVGLEGGHTGGAPNGSSGYGMRTMRQRAEVLGGTFECRTAVPRGTSLRIVVPVS